MIEDLQLRIEKAIYGGEGLARLPDGKAVMVLLTLPGELVEARLNGQRRGVAQAELTSVLEAATARTAPRCRHYGVCGGCQYQHAEYGAQLELKRGILRETLRRAGVTAPEITAHSAGAWEYRNRIRLHAVAREGKIEFGYKQRRSNTVFVLEECPIAAPVLVRAALALREALGGEAWAADVDEVEIFCDAEESAAQAGILLRPGMKGEAAEFARTMTRLGEALPELRGAGMYARAARATEAAKELAAWGEAELRCGAGGREYRVTRGAFFQVNRFMAGRLVELATAGRAGALVWDLYAGVGLFSVALARNFARVVAVESAATAAGDLRHNLAAAGAQHRAIAATTLEFLERTAAPSSRKPPELIVMDPPRAGLGAAVCALLAQVGARQMVYVSCDPVTLSRDVAALIESGYKLQAMHSVDMFPQTFHLEMVTVLHRE